MIFENKNHTVNEINLTEATKQAILTTIFIVNIIKKISVEIKVRLMFFSPIRMNEIFEKIVNV